MFQAFYHVTHFDTRVISEALLPQKNPSVLDASAWEIPVELFVISYLVRAHPRT